MTQYSTNWTKEKDAARNVKWKKENPEKVKEYNRRYRASHAEQIREYEENGREKNPVKRAGYSRAWKSNNREKDHAHQSLYKAIRSGRVIRPDTCPCGNPNPEGHHPDYSKPLMVMWLCLNCHRKLHQIIGTDRERIAGRRVPTVTIREKL